MLVSAFVATLVSIAAGGTSTAARPHLIAADTATYRIDVSHSRLVFKIRHFVSKVEGRFDRWNGSILTDPTDFSKGSVNVSIETASINTNNESRDRDLRSGNFFAADSFPALTFVSTRVELKGTAIKIFGDLTMRGISKPVILEGEYLGRQGAIGPGERIGFEASTKVNRLDWGLTWNRLAEGGGAMLGDDVTIEMTVAGVRPRPRPAP